MNKKIYKIHIIKVQRNHQKTRKPRNMPASRTWWWVAIGLNNLLHPCFIFVLNSCCYMESKCKKKWRYLDVAAGEKYWGEMKRTERKWEWRHLQAASQTKSFWMKFCKTLVSWGSIVLSSIVFRLQKTHHSNYRLIIQVEPDSRNLTAWQRLGHDEMNVI